MAPPLGPLGLSPQRVGDRFIWASKVLNSRFKSDIMRSCNWAVGSFLVFSLVSWWVHSCLQVLLMNSSSVGIVVKSQEKMKEKRFSLSSQRTLAWWNVDETSTEKYNKKRRQKARDTYRTKFKARFFNVDYKNFFTSCLSSSVFLYFSNHRLGFPETQELFLC